MDALQNVLKELPWARLIDRPARLNALFQDTRGSVIWLKLLSWLGAAVLLSVLFGWRRAVLVLAVPTAAVLATVATLGWVGLPVSLFAVFGLLLASAIGIDYAVYAQGARQGEGPERFAGILHFLCLAGPESYAGRVRFRHLRHGGHCIQPGVFRVASRHGQ